MWPESRTTLASLIMAWLADDMPPLAGMHGHCMHTRSNRRLYGAVTLSVVQRNLRPGYLYITWILCGRLLDQLPIPRYLVD